MSSIRRTILRARTRWLRTDAGRRWLRSIENEALRRRIAAENRAKAAKRVKRAS